MNKNVLFALLSIVSVQGTTYIAQVALARILSIDEFAVVRTVESTLQFLATVAPFGMSLLIVRQAPAEAGAASNRTLTAYVSFAACSAAAIAVCAAVLAPRIETTTVGRYLSLVVWSIVLTAVSRTCLNYFYGRERFAFISVVTFVTSCLSVAVTIGLAGLWALNGWVAAKYAAELLLFAVALYFFRSHLAWPRLTLASALGQFREGAAVSLALMARSVTDNCFFLVYAYRSSDATQVATYGACSLLLAGLMILPASLNSVWLARYVNIADRDARKLREQHRRNLLAVFLTGSALAAALVLLGHLFVVFLGPEYSGVPALLSLMAVMVPLRSVAVLNGHILFRFNRVEIGTAINIVTAAMAIALAFAGLYGWGLTGVVVASVVVEVVVAVAFMLYASRLLRWACARADAAVTRTS
jgi:O-antigen/teichoic acid export membrane protein